MRTLSKARYLAPLTLMLCSYIPNGFAGGLWLNEYGSPAMAKARAGAQTGTNDASTSIHNPATIGQLNGRQVMGSLSVVHSVIEFDLESSQPLNGPVEGDDAGDTVPAGSFFYADPMNGSPWAWGVSFAGVSGAALDYSDNWAGRFQATEVVLTTIALSTAFSYEVNDWLAAGLAVQVLKTNLELSLGDPNQPIVGQQTLEDDDLQLGYLLGLTAQINESTRLGFTYQTKLDFEYQDTASIPSGANAGNLKVDVSLPLADYARLGLSHDVSDRLTLHTTLGWDDWTDLTEVVDVRASDRSSAVNVDWDDTYHYAIGLDYRASPELTLSAGVSYDTSPTGTKTRTAQLPVDRQVRFGFGAQYKQSEKLTLGAQLTHVDMGSAKIRSEGAGLIGAFGYQGEYDTNEVYFIAVSANWKL